MKKVIAIMGEPGSGKTTLMSKIIDHFKFIPKYKEFKLVPYLQDDNIYLLGKYEEGEVYGGTDKMSMAVQPEAIKFLDSLKEGSIVLFEGDRLCTSTFLENCVTKYDTTIYYLKTSKDVREDRYKERNSTQNATWLAGRETKISNILSNFDLMFNTETIKNDNKEDLERNYELIVNKIENGRYD